VSIGNHAHKFIDPGFAELRFAMVLRLPRPQGERRTESRFIGASPTLNFKLSSHNPASRPTRNSKRYKKYKKPKHFANFVKKRNNMNTIEHKKKLSHSHRQH
jgi:hypothetical protein